MTRHWRTVAAALAPLLVAGCKGDARETPASGLDGTWADCSFDGVNDRREVLVVSGTGATLESIAHDTVDGSCGGRGTTDGPASFSLAVGGDVAAALGSATVTARAVDLARKTSPFDTIYTIAWRDAAAVPQALYLGDTAATSGLDGTAPEKRPDVLEGARPRTLQSALAAADLSGTWVSCTTESGSDLRESIEISADSFFSGSATYTSADGSCTGSVMIEIGYWTPLTIGAPVYASLGSRTVTALEMDTETRHSVLWVDGTVTPNLLYMGDEAATPGYDGTSASTRPNVLEDWKPRAKQ